MRIFPTLLLLSATLFSPLATAAPEVDAARLARLHAFMDGVVARGEYPGAVTLIARGGSIVDWRAYGWRDLARREPMPRDAIFRIYSMSKTVTAAAVLILMEEGRLGLDDPVAQYVPAFAGLQVYAGGTADAPVLRKPAAPLTIRHLLTHTAGFAVYGPRTEPVNALFDRAELHLSANLEDYAARLARLPLAHEPGAAFHYDGVPTQLASRIVEVVSGMPYDRFLRERLFAPLGMDDTGFEVAPAKRRRIAEMSTTDRDGRLVAPAPGVVAPAGERLNPYFSGAGGLYSTAGDYARFAQMLLDGGRSGKTRILGRKTVELMMANHLTQLSPPVNEFSPAEGWGLGGLVVLDAARRGRLGSNGQFGWQGAASTYYTIDRSERLVALLMMQHLPQGLPKDPPKLGVRFFNLVYQALE
jgi:CubicO group peptidase (beta-lactamase class C family)